MSTTLKVKLFDSTSTSTPNAGGYVYDPECLAKALKEYKKKYVDTDRAGGELYDPVVDRREMRLERLSHKITSWDISDNGDITANIEVLDTPMGKVLESLIKDSPVKLFPRLLGYHDDAKLIKIHEVLGFDLGPDNTPDTKE